jgi:hypothetical protein
MMRFESELPGIWRGCWEFGEAEEVVRVLCTVFVHDENHIGLAGWIYCMILEFCADELSATDPSLPSG